MKIILLSVCFSLTNFVFAEDIITMHKKGLFGYKEVIQQHNEITNNNFLNCSEPGFKSCKWNDNTKYSDIISTVEEYCSNDVITGKFIKGDYYVEYNYEKTSDKLVIKIYTLPEAHQNGLL